MLTLDLKVRAAVNNEILAYSRVDKILIIVFLPQSSLGPQDIIHKCVSPKVFLSFSKGKKKGKHSVCVPFFFSPNYEIKTPSSNPDSLLPLELSTSMYHKCTSYWQLWKSPAENTDTFFPSKYIYYLSIPTRCFCCQS